MGLHCHFAGPYFGANILVQVFGSLANVFQMSPRYRILVLAGAGLVAAWIIAFAGFKIAAGLKVTGDKVRSYAESMDLSKLSASDRAKALRKLADMLNALSPEERRQARMNRIWEQWFAQMTDEEKSQFIEATLPTGFKQMIGAFEEMPEDRRQRAINEALRGLREAQARMQAEGGMPATGNAPVVSEDLQKQMATIGLKTFYSQSSAQTKAEVAPLLEEMQRMMESGRFTFGGGRRGR